MAFKNYYDILNVKQTATQEEIKKAYRKLSVKFHPDKNDGDEFLSEMFKNINEANETLSNPEKRKEFDATLNANNNYSSSSNYSTTQQTEKDDHELAKKYKTLHANLKAYFDQQKVVVNKKRLYSEAVNEPKPKHISFLSIIILSITALVFWIMFKPKAEASNNTPETTQNKNIQSAQASNWTTKEMAEIYQDPDIESKILGHAQRNQSFEALEETKYFIKISYERGSVTETGYLRKKQLTKN